MRREAPIRRESGKKSRKTPKKAATKGLVVSKSLDTSTSVLTWSNYIPEEILLRIFQLAIAKNENRLKLLLRYLVLPK